MAPRRAYDEELSKLNAEIVHMSDVAKETVKKGMQAFLEGERPAPAGSHSTGQRAVRAGARGGAPLRGDNPSEPAGRIGS